MDHSGSLTLELYGESQRTQLHYLLGLQTCYLTIIIMFPGNITTVGLIDSSITPRSSVNKQRKRDDIGTPRVTSTPALARGKNKGVLSYEGENDKFAWHNYVHHHQQLPILSHKIY